MLNENDQNSLNNLLKMLETKTDDPIPKFKRKYDNFGKYITTLGMFEFYCKKGEYSKALHELEETVFLNYPVGDLKSYNVIRKSIEENLGV